ncbi:hypothetical protein DPMN_106497 [Dreissena polymorpha]|uniref:Uncharacterized protein n=1 Tax=Dreissena polymorpha TaxID=45954 RepID=A0A9D4K5B3_DREPO|nr:hypothetical protein DPMN_106497 [Dreissena polymorpha]
MTKPTIPHQKRTTPEVDMTKEINFPPESESDSGSETSKASPRYIIPHRRRPLPQPCVNFSRPELPSSISRGTCDGKSSNNSTGRSNLAFNF